MRARVWEVVFGALCIMSHGAWAGSPTSKATQLLNSTRKHLIEEDQMKTPGPGTLSLAVDYEHQASSTESDGKTVVDLEYVLVPPLLLSLESEVHRSLFLRREEDRERQGLTHAAGMGDTEAKAFFRLVGERSLCPELSLVGTVKFPTARHRRLGTREIDHGAFLQTRKEINNTDVELAFGMTRLGAPHGVVVEDPIFHYSMVVESNMTEFLSFVGELDGNTSATLVNSSLPDNAPLVQETKASFNMSLGFRWFLPAGLALGVACHSDHSFRLNLGWVFQTSVY